MPRSLQTFILALFGLVGLALPLGCVNDPSVDNPATITNPNPVTQTDTGVSDTAPQSVTISGHTATVDGIAIPGAWVGISDDSTQQLVIDTTSDANGAFSITLPGTMGNYMLLASYQVDDNSMIAGWQAFSISDEPQDFTADLSLSELPIIDEADASGAVPPPSGGCWMVYTNQYMCSWHVWYVYTYYTGSGAAYYYCFLLGGGFHWTAIGSC